MNPIRKNLSEGAPAIGGWIWYPNGLAAEVVARAGLPWAVLDAQHAGANWDNLAPTIQALELGGCAAVVRVGWIDEAMIMRALDLGAVAVIVPMVSTAADAARVAQAMRYPPEGIRSFGATRVKYATTEAANRDVLALPMIETAEGLKNVDAIAATAGIDGLFVGFADLALSMGLPLPGPSDRHPDLVAAFDAIVAAARRHGKFVGTLAFSESQLDSYLERGFRFLVLNSDRSYLTKGVATDLAIAKAAIEKWRGV
jgi:4-hydroxy-2-oxoheptanedioate aldolase